VKHRKYLLANEEQARQQIFLGYGFLKQRNTRSQIWTGEHRRKIAQVYSGRVNKNAAAVNNRVSSSYNKKVDYILSSPAAEYGQHQKESANGTNFICTAEQHQ